MRAILKERTTGQFKEGYEDYGKLLTYLGQSEHNSCLLITSREKPSEFALMEEGGENSPVQPLPLSGLTTEEGKQIIRNKGLKGSDEQIHQLIENYSGNPLALLIVSDMIRTVYGGQLSEFLKEEGRIFGEIQEVLDEAFKRSLILSKSSCIGLQSNEIRSLEMSYSQI